MKFLTIPMLFLLLFSINAIAQTGDAPRIISNDFPRFTIDSATGMQCVIFTLEQAKRIDNDEELLKVYQQLNVGADSLIKSLLFKVKVSDTEVAFLKLKIVELEKVNASQKMLISNLKEQIEDYKKNVALANQQLGLKDEQIKNLNKEIKRQKKLKVFGFGVGGVGFVVALLALL